MGMVNTITALLMPTLVMGGFALPLHAGIMISGTLSGDATLTANSQGVYVQNFSGDGDDTTFGSFTSQATSNVDFSAPPAVTISAGMLTETFPNGTLFGTSSGSGTASGLGTATVTIDFIITGGTGIFAGASGETTFTGTITATSATTESITGSYVGTLSTVPEPASVVVWSGLLALSSVVQRWRRRAVGSLPRPVQKRDR